MCNSKKITCPRCGGSGKVEHTHIVHGVCFMCKGSGETYPKRVEEYKVKEKAKRKKVVAEAKIKEERNEIYWNKVYEELTRRNMVFFEKYTIVNENLIETMQKISDLLNINETSKEADVRKMIEDFFKSECYYYRFDISKYTLKYHKFYYVSLDGRENDFTNSMHEVQNLIKI